MIASKLGYFPVNNTTATVKAGPAGFFGLSVLGAGNVSVYDNTTGSGTLICTKTGMVAGDQINFGGLGIACGKGITVVTTGNVVALFT